MKVTLTVNGVARRHADAPREMKVRFNYADQTRQKARTVRVRRVLVWRRSAFCLRALCAIQFFQGFLKLILWSHPVSELRDA